MGRRPGTRLYCNLTPNPCSSVAHGVMDLCHGRMPGTHILQHCNSHKPMEFTQKADPLGVQLAIHCE